MKRERVKIHALGHKSFVGRVLEGAGAGKTVFLQQAVPGETYVCKLLKEERNYIEAEIIEQEDVSEVRVTPPCVHFERCGGCDLQHISLAAQREMKQELLKDVFSKKAAINVEKGIEVLGRELPGVGYRRRVQLRVDANGKLGYYAKKSKELVGVDSCLVATEVINSCFDFTFNDEQRGLLYRLDVEDVSGKLVAAFRLRKPVRNPEKIYASFLPLLSDYKFFFKNKLLVKSKDSAVVGSFSQVNTEVNCLLQRLVCTNAEGANEILELYAGGGNLTFSLAAALPRAKITAVEADNVLVNAGKSRGKDGVTFRCMKAEEYVRKNVCPELLVLDPPRSGAKDVVREVVKSADLKRVLYVSCYVPTLLRDVVYMVEHGFKVKKVYGLDMFPHTYHIETFTILEKV